MTANALKGEADNCLAVGMDEYLTKPVSTLDLHSVLMRRLPAAGVGDRALCIHRIGAGPQKHDPGVPVPEYL